MLVLHHIDPVRRQMTWARVETGLPGAEHVRQIESRLPALGIRDFVPTSEEVVPTLAHEWTTRGAELDYMLQVPRKDLVPSLVSYYVAAALATVIWANPEDLMSVHLAVYELIMNIHDHGRSLACTDPSINLRLRVCRSSIRGQLVDGCERFDPGLHAPVDVLRRVAGREPRGYGVTMIQRSVDNIEYEFGPDGNVVSFEKGIQT